MLRIISLFLLLIISRVSFAETIPATKNTISGYTISAYNLTDQSYSNLCQVAFGSFSSFFPQFSAISIYSSSSSSCTVLYKDTQDRQSFYSFSISNANVDKYSCPSGYNLSDSSGALSSSGQYCTKSACADSAGLTTQLWFLRNTVPTSGCYAGCTVTANVAVNYGDSSVEMPYVYQTFTYKDEVCPASNLNYVDAATAEAANAAAAESARIEAAKAACGSAGYDIGTANGQTVVTCKVPDSPSTSTDTSTGTDSTSSGVGTDAGSPETNTSGTQNSTVGGGTGSLGGSGYGQGGTSGGGADSGSTSGSGTDSGGTSGSGTDSGGTSGSGTDSGGTSGSGTDSGGTSGSGTDSGGTSGSGTDSGGTSGSGTDSGSGSGSGADSGSGSGSGSDSASGTGTGEDTEEESDESGSYPGADSSFDYADTDRETRTVTDVFKENYEKFKSTELVSSATGFFTVNLSGGACSVIQFDIFGSAVSFDPCAFLEYITSLMRIAVLFACSFFAFRIAME